MIINNLVKTYNLPEPGPKVLARIPTEEQRQFYIQAVKRSNKAI